MSIEKINVLGVGVSVLNLQSATQFFLDSINRRTRGYICVTSVHGIIEARQDAEFRDILNRAALCTPDGIPLVWFGRGYYGKQDIARVYGPDLMWEVFRATENKPVRHFFYGGKEGIAEKLRDRLLRHFPNATIAGTFCPPFRPLNADEEKALLDAVNEARPDIIWVGLSTPKQERFMAKYLPRLNTTLMAGVGAAFDIHANVVRQAPEWMQRSGFEWLFRITQEPGRLWPRYRRINPKFLFLIARELLSKKKPLD